jgi:hypothetical protein
MSISHVNRIGSKNANVGCVSRLHTEMAQSGAKIHSPSFNLGVEGEDGRNGDGGRVGLTP